MKAYEKLVNTCSTDSAMQKEPKELPPLQPQKPASNDPYGCDTPQDLTFTASLATECTGLVPTPPLSEAEQESYQEIYPYTADGYQ